MFGCRFDCTARYGVVLHFHFLFLSFIRCEHKQRPSSSSSLLSLLSYKIPYRCYSRYTHQYWHGKTHIFHFALHFSNIVLIFFFFFAPLYVDACLDAYNQNSTMKIQSHYQSICTLLWHVHIIAKPVLI